MNISFLTLPDPRIKPSGSRDPLGFQTIWVKLGRELVGDNLTTITSSIDNFIVALLACHYSFKEKDEDKKMEVFFKVEQLGAYFRIPSGHKNNIMGITQAQKNYDANRIILGKDGQIFGNQKTSGLWGYYSSALMMSGLINQEKNQIEDSGIQIINKVIEKFSFDEFINRSSIDTDTIKKYANSFIQGLGLVYQDMVGMVLNKSKFNIYNMAVSYFQSTPKHINYNSFYDWMKKNYKDDDLTVKLLEIKEIDKTLWVASKVFEFCRTQKDIKIDDVAGIIEKSSLATIELKQSDLKMKRFIELWNTKEFVQVIRELVNMHAEAMKSRSSAKWLTIKDEKLNVIVGAKMVLPTLKESIPWQYNYFLHSYISVAYQVYIEGQNHG
jgi:hypothetical protein